MIRRQIDRLHECEARRFDHEHTSFGFEPSHDRDLRLAAEELRAAQEKRVEGKTERNRNPRVEGDARREVRGLALQYRRRALNRSGYCTGRNARMPMALPRSFGPT